MLTADSSSSHKVKAGMQEGYFAPRRVGYNDGSCCLGCSDHSEVIRYDGRALSEDKSGAKALLIRNDASEGSLHYKLGFLSHHHHHFWLAITICQAHLVHNNRFYLNPSAT